MRNDDFDWFDVLSCLKGGLWAITFSYRIFWAKVLPSDPWRGVLSVTFFKGWKTWPQFEGSIRVIRKKLEEDLCCGRCSSSSKGGLEGRFKLVWTSSPTFVLKFHALKRTDQPVHSVPWNMMLSNRCKHQAYQYLVDLSYHGIWQLCLTRLKPSTLQRSALVDQLQKSLRTL